MNKNSNKSRVAAFFAGKGFYIVLILCVAAIGVSGYYILRSNVSGTIEEPESIAVASIPSAEVSVVIDEEAADILESDAVPVMAIPSVSDEELAETASSTKADLVVWPVSGDTLKPYSVDALVYNVTLSDWRVHNGLDIACPLDTQVMSASAGTVADVYDDDFLGTTVVIYHADSVTTKYSNMSTEVNVSPGDVIAAGDVIGTVGGTALGESGDAPHLHLEVYKEGVSIDPMTFLG